MKTNFLKYILQDWHANQGNPKGRFLMFFFRIAFFLRTNKILKIIFLPYLVAHVLFFDWFLNVDIPLQTKLGKGCVIFHGHALVINAFAEIGDNCILRHSTTIGNKLDKSGNETNSPVLGNNCELGASVIIIGPIIIGDNVTVGAGAIVTKNIPSNSIAYGNPLIIKPK